MNANARLCVLIPLSALVICGESALAQTQQQDAERLQREGVERNDAAARAHGFEMERQRQERERQAEESRRSQSQSSTSTGGGYTPSPSGGYTPSPSGGNSAGTGRAAADMRALGKEMLRLPPLPAERNVLLGSWRLEGGGPQRGVAEFALTGKGNMGFGDVMGFLSSLDSGKFSCDLSFGHGITFTPTTYSSGGVAGMAGGPIAYRSRNKQVIVAIPADSRANPMPFEIAGPNRIVWGGNCALVRVGAPATNAAANTTTSPGSARTGTANSSLLPAARAMPQVAAVAPSPTPKSSTALQAAGAAGVVVDGAAFRCGDGSLLHVSLCQGNANDATCKLTELHLPGLQMGKPARRADIAARVNGCEAGGIAYGADNKPVFVR